MLKVWGRKTSSNVQALMWCIGELGLDYERIDVGHRFGGLDTDAFIKLNPNRSIPVLQDGEGEPLWETGCILRYLASRYGKGTFWPEDLLARTGVDQWAEWSKLNIAHGFTVPVFWRMVRTAEADRDPQAIRLAVRRLEEKLQIADARLSQQMFLASNNFTLADIQFGHCLFRYFDIDIERSDLPALAAYYDRLTQRPAFIEHVMVSYEDLRVT
jgi:glutathione S-transferase